MGGERRAGALHRKLCPILVDRGIQTGVVIHFQLPVKLEASSACQCVVPQSIEALGQVGALFDEDGEPDAIALDVAGKRIRPLSLFAGVVDLERQNGKPIDDETF